ARGDLRAAERRLLGLPEREGVLGPRAEDRVDPRSRPPPTRAPSVTVSIIDYGLGNLGSVVNMLKRVGAQSRRVSTAQEVLESERVLLPGIGAFDLGVDLLDQHGLIEPLREFAASGRP